MNKNHKDPSATKALVAAAATLIGLVATVFVGQETFDRETLIMAITAVVTTGGVYIASNHSQDEAPRR